MNLTEKDIPALVAATKHAVMVDLLNNPEVLRKLKEALQTAEAEGEKQQEDTTDEDDEDEQLPESEIRRRLLFVFQQAKRFGTLVPDHWAKSFVTSSHYDYPLIENFVQSFPKSA